MRRITAFWQAVIVLVITVLIFIWAFPPFMPRSLMITYLIICSIGLLLYFSSDDQRWDEFKKPIISTLSDDNKALLRWPIIIVLALLPGYVVYQGLKPSLEKPLELRQIHPSPPAEIKVYDKSYDLAKLENPIRMSILEQLEKDSDAAWETYKETVQAGSLIYYNNCFYCHGDLLDGKGHFAKALDPLPTDFSDVGTIAQLQESFLFWRITTGGPGLPKGGMPWNSAMPVWHEMLSEEDVWNVIIFLYDYVEQVPRMWDQAISRSVSNMKDATVKQRASLDSTDIYQLRCAVCHGETGAGDGPAADFLYPRPRDFTAGLWKYKTSPGDLPPRDEDLFNAIKHGLEGTSMPAWSKLISDQHINGLVDVIKGFDTTAIWAPEDAADEDFDDEGRYLKASLAVKELEPTSGQLPYSEESVKRGREVFEENCEKCHGEAGRGNITSGELLDDDWGFRIWPRDLTKPWTWRATQVNDEASGRDSEKSREATIRNIYTRISIGIKGTPMPSHRAVDEGEEDAISLEDRWHLANYTYSLRSGATWPGERNVIEAVEWQGELLDNTDDENWLNVPASTFRLLPNIIKQDRLFTPINDSVTVRVIYNENEIAFLLEINDRTKSVPGGEVMKFLVDQDEKIFPDAVALQFPKEDAYSTTPVEKPLFRHGDKQHHTTIWYWNAGSIEPAMDSRNMLFDATGPNSKLSPRKSDSDLSVQANWNEGQWRVLFKRPRGVATSDGQLTANDNNDLVFRKGQFIPVSFANWEGNNGEAGSKHTLTPWFWLLLPHETDYAMIYSVSAAVSLVFLFAGIFIVWYMRRQPAAIPQQQQT